MFKHTWILPCGVAFFYLCIPCYGDISELSTSEWDEKKENVEVDGHFISLNPCPECFIPLLLILTNRNQNCWCCLFRCPRLTVLLQSLLKPGSFFSLSQPVSSLVLGRFSAAQSARPLPLSECWLQLSGVKQSSEGWVWNISLSYTHSVGVMAWVMTII